MIRQLVQAKFQPEYHCCGGLNVRHHIWGLKMFTKIDEFIITSRFGDATCHSKGQSTRKIWVALLSKKFSFNNSLKEWNAQTYV